MSDLPAAVPLPESRVKKEPAATWSNANAVVQTVLQQLAATERRLLTVRCEELPQLQIAEEELTHILERLVRMILQKGDGISRLFLHISCKQAAGMPGETGNNEQYTIQLHTNITPCVQWMATHKEQLANLTATVNANNGSLTMTQVITQGCIFYLSLPGKLF